jgi:adenylate kinase family enzyme
VRRVLVIGPSGGGKSTLSRRLARRTGLPLIHLDAEYWQPGWVEPSKPAWAERIHALLARETWIMDGNYSNTLAQRVVAADTIVFLDVPRWQCFAGVFGRWWKTRGRTREDMAPGCAEQFPSLTFLRWIWRYQERSRPTIVALLEALPPTTRVIVLRSRGEIEQFARTIEQAC